MPCEMSELHPVVDDTLADPRPVTRRSRRMASLAVWSVVLVVIAIGAALALDVSPVLAAVAVLSGALILWVGWFFLRTVGTPPPPPPEPGTIRKVKLVYRCSVCGAEVRMTAAPTEEPEPPRHCFENMDLVAPID